MLGILFALCYQNLKYANKTLGIVLLIAGVLMVVFTGFNFKTKEKVVDLGVVEINKEKNHPIHWSPIIGGALIVGGIVLIAVNKKAS